MTNSHLTPKLPASLTSHFVPFSGSEDFRLHFRGPSSPLPGFQDTVNIHLDKFQTALLISLFQGNINHFRKWEESVFVNDSGRENLCHRQSTRQDERTSAAGGPVRRGMLKDAAGGAPGTTLQRAALRLHISPSHNCYHKHYFLS